MCSLVSIVVVTLSLLTAARAANTRQDCVESILQRVPHMAKAFEHLDLPRGAFTMFAPTEVAADRFLALFTRDGCTTISKKRLKELVNASLVPGHKLRVDKLTASPRQYQGALPGHALELSKGQGGGVQIGVVDPKGELSDVIAEARPAPPLRSCSRGALFLSDDLVVPPALRARVLQALNGEGGCPDDLGSDDKGPDGTEDATVLATSAELEAPSTTASVPVSARVRATATDEDGNVTPLDTDVTLDVQAGLEEIGLAKSTDVTVEVPVTVQVNVDGGPCDTEGADVAVPVDVDVSVDILVDGQRIGTGNGGVVFVRCREGAVARWGQCGGIVYSRRGAPKRFAAACAEGACVRKNRWFAMCVPDDTQRVFKGQGWDGKVLVCR